MIFVVPYSYSIHRTRVAAVTLIDRATAREAEQRVQSISPQVAVGAAVEVDLGDLTGEQTIEVSRTVLG